MAELKSINDYLVDWRKKRDLPEIDLMADSIVKDILELVGEYNFNLKWKQIAKVESALGDLITRAYERKDVNMGTLVITGFIIICGEMNK